MKDSIDTISYSALIESGEAEKIVPMIMREFHIDDKKRVERALIKGVTRSAQTVEDLGAALEFIAPFALKAEISLEQVVFALALLANRGIRGHVLVQTFSQTWGRKDG